MTTHLVWFRSDLRINDNLALHAACRDKQANVLALFIATPAQWKQHDMSPKQAGFIYHALQSLQQSLAERGITLHYLQSDDFTTSVQALSDFCQQHKVNHLFYNYQYEVNERQRDAQVEKKLGEQEIACQGFDDSVLLAPGSIQTGDGQMFKVYTPYSRAVVKRLREELPCCVTAPQTRANAPSKKLPSLKPFSYPTAAFDHQLFPVDEQAALTRLRQFSQQPAITYAEARDLPAKEATSRLSVYLATGVLSPRQCLQRLLKNHPDALNQGKAFTWVNELIWRDFYRHLLVAHPRLCRHKPFIDWTDRVKWQTSPQKLSAWKAGKTGFPIVDAAMRQLNQTGWMHNRLRMIVASFLTKDLLIDWREGERYFITQLIDGDLAANNGGWQWAASTGTDSAPYFRIFNPTTQGQRFDPQGEFIRQWLPELKQVPDSAIHTPHTWAKKNSHTLDYPAPIVDHKTARKQTLDAFEQAKKQAK